MSDRRINNGDPGDPGVSAAYREIADERTPAHLDHTVLNAARAAARPSWNRAVAWLRPAAWAATIGVCLAVVVEITLLPDPDLADSGGGRDEPAAALPAAETERLENARPQVMRSQELQRVQAAQDPAVRTGDSREAADTAVEEVVKPRDRRWQLTSGDMKSTAATPAAAPASEPATLTAAERYCDESETGDPDTWLECILRLEREGLPEAARLERERLAEAFPPPELP